MGRPAGIKKPTSLTIRIESEMYGTLLALAEAKRVSMSVVARWALEAFINSEKEKQSGTNKI